MKNKLKVYRAMREMTQEQLAEAIGVSRQTVIAIERTNIYPHWVWLSKFPDFSSQSRRSFFSGRNGK
jgi:putative transcriptional regulator